MMFRFRLFLLGLAVLAASALLRAADAGTVTGTVVYPDSGKPVEFVEITLRKPDGTVVQRAATDAHGRFALEQVPAGNYQVGYNRVGEEGKSTAPFTVDAAHAKVDLGRLNPPDTALQLEKFEVKARQDKFLNSIDRKTYNVGKDIQSTAGSASDLLQNVPSVDVDIDGNVSLRGSDNVLILINGRASTLMGRSRAEVLAQLPADEIEKIEVITNPSARYKPDGTSGIINIQLKRKHDGGLSGTVNASAGNLGRYSAGASLNYHPGAYNLFGSFSVRQDDRPRFATDDRVITDPVTGAVIHADKHTVETSKPFTRVGRAGFDYAPDEDNQVGLAGSYNRRTFRRHATDINLVTDGTGAVTSDYDRTRFDPEYEQDLEVSGTYRHTFAPDHELNLELKTAWSDELEDNHYADIFRAPVQAPTYDNTWIRNSSHNHEAIAEYTRPLANDAKLEAGYDLTDDNFAADFRGELADPATGRFVPDPATTNYFTHERTVHAFYATYTRAVGQFGFMAGLRPELTYGTSHLVNTGATIPNNYARVYPTLHLAYHLTDEHEFQLNYSHRVRRPEIDDLNPFPEYSDPFTLRAGNPRLLPEDTHSVEGGYSYHHGDVNFTSTAYDRLTYHGFTNFTTDLGGGVLLTTHENLATSNAAGLELTAAADLGTHVTVNFSSNTFYNTIDASNLGFSSSRSDISWLAKLGLTAHLTKSPQLQFNTNYSSARLTAQGERRPTYVANLGVRHDLAQKKAAIVLTVSDLFNSLKETYVLDTPLLHETATRRRSARIVYLGFLYNFGTPSKKQKDDPLKFDNSL